MNYLFYEKDLRYPSEKNNYSPSEKYPEYQFEDVSCEFNHVYASIRQMFYLMKLDINNYGTAEWNPLGKWIKPGQSVVLKPNFVNHKNESENPDELDSLVTHPSIIRCVLDYCLIALKGKGQVIVGDAPVKDCNFALLMKRRNYNMVQSFFAQNGFSIDFVDFRGPEEEGGQYVSAGEGILVNLGKDSFFYNCNHDESKYRVPNYSADKVVKHHQGEIQEYLINSTIVNADVIINLPKPKTHRKNGYTAALKNFVGANYSKEYLPHHTEGAVLSGGDEYLNDSMLRRFISLNRKKIDVNRIKKDKLRRDNANIVIRKIYGFKHKVLWGVNDALLGIDRRKNANKKLDEQALEGAWHGNDTLWRTVLDLNKCVLYSAKDGSYLKKPQRTIISLGDMIVSGEKEGPMAPSPKQQHMLLFSENCVSFDAMVVNIMGFDYRKFKGLVKALECEKLIESKYDEIFVNSNNPSYAGKLKDLCLYNIEGAFIPGMGWKNNVEV